MSAAIEVRGLRKRFGSRTALHGLDLTVGAGTIFGLIGPNGAGKTTTLRILLDIIRPSGGEVSVLGEDPRRGGAALRRRIGFVPGELRLEGRVTGRRMLDFYASVSGPVVPGRIEELAERLGLDLTRRVRTLSKGNKQKLGLVQAFMHEPELLILDEPTSGLDPLVQREFLQLVREARERGQTVLLSSHVLSEIQQAADEVAVLSEGRIVAAGDVASLRLGAVRRIRTGIAETGADDVRAALQRLPTSTRLHDLVISDGSGLVRVSATAEGEIDALVKTLARFRLVDLTVEEPDLEESVLRLYGSARGRAGAASTSTSAVSAATDAAADRMSTPPGGTGNAPGGATTSNRPSTTTDSETSQAPGESTNPRAGTLSAPGTGSDAGMVPPGTDHVRDETGDASSRTTAAPDRQSEGASAGAVHPAREHPSAPPSTEGADEPTASPPRPAASPETMGRPDPSAPTSGERPVPRPPRTEDGGPLAQRQEPARPDAPPRRRRDRRPPGGLPSAGPVQHGEEHR